MEKKDRTNELREIAEKYNRLPKKCIKEERSLYRWMNYNKDNSGVKELMEKYGEEKIDYLQRFIDFVKEYHRLPKISIKEECSLYQWMRLHKDIPEVKELMKKYKEEKIDYTQRLIDFIVEHHRLPKGSIKEEQNLYHWMNNHKDIQEVKKLIEKYKIDYFQRLINFTKEYNRLPKDPIKEEQNLYNWMNRHKDIPQVKELIEKYGEKKIDYTKKIINFIVEHHRLPKSNIKEEINLYNLMRIRIKEKEKYPEIYLYYTLFTHKDEPGVKDMTEKLIRETLSD